MFVSFNVPQSTIIINIQKTSINATTTAVNAVVLQENQYLHIQNEAPAIAYIAIGTATANPASATSAFWRIPPNTDAYFEAVPTGQLNVALSAGTGRVSFVVGSRA